MELIKIYKVNEEKIKERYNNYYEDEKDCMKETGTIWEIEDYQTFKQNMLLEDSIRDLIYQEILVDERREIKE